MPLPNPRKNEKEKEFISRCISDSIMSNEYPNLKQRTAICYNQWREKKMSEEEIIDNLDAFDKACRDTGDKDKLVKDFIGELARGDGQGTDGPVQKDGGTDTCVCPECSTEIVHKKGIPCAEVKCPKCGNNMMGK